MTATKEVAVPSLDGVPLELDRNAACLPPRAYSSEAFFDAEMRDVLPHSWVFVGDERELQKPGDFLVEEVGDVPVAIVRATDGVVRALSNVCSHQACTLLQGRGNTGKSIRCPYHGWGFALDGRLVGVPMPDGFEEPLDRSAYGLRQVRLEAWKGLMFVNVFGDAPPLNDYLEAIPETLGNHDFGDLDPVLALDETVDVNWKVLVDNFGEDYHCPLVHKDTLCSDLLPAQMVDQEWTNTADIFTDQRLDRKAAASGLFDVISPKLTGDTKHRVHVFRVFPQLSLIGSPNGEGWVQLYTPIAPKQTRVRLWVYKQYPEPLTPDETEFIQTFMGEDFAVCQRIQRGLASPLYPGPGPLHRLQKPARVFRRRLLESLRGAIDHPAA